MQLIAGRTAQEYNWHKNRHRASGRTGITLRLSKPMDHLHQCVVYIDLNMVRDGVVKHPRKSEQSGYREIQKPV